MRISNDRSNVIMSIPEHNHFFKLCQAVRIVISNDLYRSQCTHFELMGIIEVKVNVGYIRSNFNLLLLYYYNNGREDKFMDDLKQIVLELGSQ